MAANNRRSFNFWTWFWFGFVIALKRVFGAFRYIPGFAWLAARDRKSQQHRAGTAARPARPSIDEIAEEQERLQELDRQEAALVDEWTELYEKTTHQLVIDSFGPNAIGCRTCGAVNPKSMFPETQVCVSLADVHPHNPNEDAPEDNPYWAWGCQLHGFEMPPPDWPKDQVFMHPYAGRPDFLQIAEERGKKYWLKHRNYAWDNGFGEPPDWYVKQTLESPRAFNSPSPAENTPRGAEPPATLNNQVLALRRKDKDDYNHFWLRHQLDLARNNIRVACSRYLRETKRNEEAAREAEQLAQQVETMLHLNTWLPLPMPRRSSDVSQAFIAEVNEYVEGIRDRAELVRIPLDDIIAAEQQNERTDENSKLEWLEKCVDDAHKSLEEAAVHFRFKNNNPAESLEVRRLGQIVRDIIDHGEWFPFDISEYKTPAGAEFAKVINQHIVRLREQEKSSGVPLFKALPPPILSAAKDDSNLQANADFDFGADPEFDNSL